MVAVRAADDERDPFLIGRVLSKGDDSIRVHWYGNLHHIALGTYRPGWVRASDGEIYFADKPMAKSHAAYTNEHDSISVPSSTIAAHSFQLTAHYKLPKRLLHQLSKDSLVQWALPDKS